MKTLWKQKPIRDKKYLDWIKTLPCLICGKESEPHHVNLKGHGGKGTKTDDNRCINLCHSHHLEIHLGRDTFANKYDIDYEKTIARLNMIYGVDYGA